ncbi:MAG: penicillin-binding protein 2 [Actinomycetota bacterium]|nr:penicillin-binding protein 2 [Actinomycetota bacterium]
MNTQIRRLGIGMLVLFCALFLQLNYLQIVDADRLNDHPANTRTVVRDFSRPRGVIQTADGRVLAVSNPTEGEFKRLRTYPEGPLFAHITGFFSFSFGSEGVERTYNGELTGRDQELRFDRIGDMLLQEDQSANVTLTIPYDLQKVATDALGSTPGAVVALDPRSGAVLAMADFPSYDPNLLSGHDQAAVRRAWDTLNADRTKPLLPRAYRERYPPGSSFKVITAAVGLATGVVTVDRPVYPTLTALPVPGSPQPIGNFGGASCGGNLPQVMRVSCNTAFAQMGLDEGAERLSSGARNFGFDQVPPIDLPFGVASVFPPAGAFARDKPALAKSAIGQQDVAATPLQMAMVAAGIANNGVVMAPHVMSEVRDSEGEVLERFEPRPWLTAVPAGAARTTAEMMVGVVEGGTGRAAAIPGVRVAGKTGTAQTSGDRLHVWFIGFAPAENPQIAVAVMLENQPVSDDVTGGRLAAPIAKAVMQAALR